MARSKRPLRKLVMMPRKHCVGFTLIEVLVALAVLAIALAAVMHALSQAIDISTSLRDRSIALWVAQDRIALHRMRRDWPAISNIEGTTEMAGETWRWREKIVTTPVADLRRIEVEVRDVDGEDILVRLVGFVRNPQAKS